MVAELFGPTVQGEGPSLGRQAVFVRLAGCHLSCSWCDTSYTWDARRFDLAANRTAMTVDQVLEWVRDRSADLVVVTGGEPLLQQDALTLLVAALDGSGYRIEVETSGTVAPREKLIEAVTAFNVSPKLAHSGLSARHRIRPAVLDIFAASGKAVFKFVATTLPDLDEIAALQQAYTLAPIWVMPEGITTDQVLAHTRLLADAVIARGWNLTTRLHIIVWGDQRGR